jgi:hypothetical protein
VDGKPVKIGGTSYIVPDVNIDAAEEIFGLLATLRDGKYTPRAVAQIVCAALRENYPDLKEKDIAKSIKLRASLQLVKDVMAAAGLDQGGSAEGEAQSPSA